MSNKELQEQRIRGYFIQAAKEILKGEGIQSINVRNVSERAGYSYATLYNYFKDLKDLIFECVKDFLSEMRKTIEAETKKSKPGTERIKAIILAYTKYYIQYPGIFDLFFNVKISDLAGKQPTVQLIYSFQDELCRNDWDYCIKEKLFSEKESHLLKENLKFISHGLLMFYLNRRSPAGYKEFMSLLNEQINFGFSVYKKL